MNGLRFAVGESAKLVVGHPNNIGNVLTITAIGPFNRGAVVLGVTIGVDGDYVARFGEHMRVAVMDYQLRKMDLVVEPVALVRASAK